TTINLMSMNQIRWKIKRFIDLLFCCSKIWYDNEDYRYLVKQIAIIISDNSALRDIATSFIIPIKMIQPNVYIGKYIKEHRSIEKSARDKEFKQKLIQEYGA